MALSIKNSLNLSSSTLYDLPLNTIATHLYLYNFQETTDCQPVSNLPIALGLPQKFFFYQDNILTLKIFGIQHIAYAAYLIAMLDRLFAEKFSLGNYALLLNFRKCLINQDEWNYLQTLLHQLSVSFSHAPHLVLDNKQEQSIIFEFVAIEKNTKATLCSGGYCHSTTTSSSLSSFKATIDTDKLPCTLECKIPSSFEKRPLHVIIPRNTACIPLALLLADELHAHELRAEILIEKKSLKDTLCKAQKLCAATCVIIGAKEQAQGIVTIQSMINGTEISTAQRDIVKYLSTTCNKT